MSIGSAYARVLVQALVVTAFGLVVLATPNFAAAGGTQGGADMVLINPKGGQLASGSDGMQIAFNGAGSTSPQTFTPDGYKPAIQSNPGTCPGFRQTNGSIMTSGADQEYFMETGQWNYQGEGIVLNIGGTLYGAGGPAVNDDLDPATPAGTDWTSIEIVSTSGSTLRVPAGDRNPNPATFPDLGSGSAHIRYKVTRGGLDYIINRYADYTYPDSLYTDRFEITVPTGNTEKVVFYRGGDATPGNCDDGIAFQTLNPGRTLYASVPSSQIYVGYGEIPGSEPFSHWYDWQWRSNGFPPFSLMYSGSDLDDNVNNGVAPPDPATTHDNSLNMQWSFPNTGGVTTPGTYNRSMFVTVGQQNVQASASFSDPEILVSETSNLVIQVLNSTFNDANGTVAVSLPLPAGLTIAGTATNTCGGTLTAADGGTSVALTGGTVLNSNNCVITVPVRGAAGSYQVSDQDLVVTSPVVKGFGVANLTITEPTPPPVDKFELSVIKSGNGEGTVEGSGIDCGSTCSTEVDKDTVVRLTATASRGSRFSGWSGTCSGSIRTCSVKMNKARSVNAKFTKVSNSFTLSNSISGNIMRSRVRVPGSGRIDQTATRKYRGKTVSACASVARRVSRAGTYTLECRANAATRAARRLGAVRIQLCTSYLPTGGTVARKCRTVVLSSTKPQFTG